MRRIIKILFLSFFMSTLNAQDINPEMLGFDAFKIQDKSLGEINYYISKESNDKPLLLYLDGSGAFPLFQKIEQGIGSTVVIDFQNLSKEYKIVLISKPGVPFIDNVGSDENGFPKYDAPKEYIEKLTLDWRVESANMVINEVLENNLANTNKVVVLGFSEGAQVAPHLANVNEKVTHLMLFGGNGLNQLFDPIITTRMNAKIGKISEAEAQKTIDSLFTQYKSIYKNAMDVESSWWGHSYARWSSFTQKSPIDILVNLDIPIYIANGSLDENSVLSADYINLEFIKRGKSNLTYKTYPGCDHQFNELHFENGQFKQAVPKIQFVMNEVFKWLKEI